LFEFAATDAGTHAEVAAGLTLTALIGFFVLARRASTVDPTETLRAE
jgi:hypothetical protein